MWNLTALRLKSALSLATAPSGGLPKGLGGLPGQGVQQIHDLLLSKKSPL